MRTRDLATTARAQGLRAVSTGAETRLWSRLRGRRLAGIKFVRQCPVGPYFADFACREAKLIVELDGAQHEGSAHDAQRDAWLAAQGWRVVRLWNWQLSETMDEACAEIAAALENRSVDAMKPRIGARAGDAGVAPHPALRATFSPLHGEKEANDRGERT